jgi:hypothetical protein
MRAVSVEELNVARRLLASIALAGVIALVASLPVSGQSSSAPVPDLVVTAFNGASAPPYNMPRTPWGDPDLQGVWSSDDATFPVSRTAGRGGGGRGGAPQANAAPPGLYLTDEQWAARQKTIQDGIRNAENAIGSFRGDFARRPFRQTSYIVDPPDGNMPQPTADAQKRRAPRDQGTFGAGPFDWTTDFTNYDRCITRGIWGSVARVVYGNGNRIVQAPGMVAITYEMIHDTRVIYTDGRPHLNTRIRGYLGDSRGRWEGDTLVVETTNLTDQTSIGANGNGLRHSAQIKMTEKIRRVASDILQYQLTVEDPVTYPRPFTMSIPLTPLDGGDLLPYECHEGNEAIRNSLGAERAEDRAVAADLAKGIKRERRPVQDGLDVGGRPTGAGARGDGAGPGRGGAAPDPNVPPREQ